jgi:glycosyltransferase involved in cell wall biosynthesis
VTEQSITHLTSVHPRYDTRIFFKECRSLVNGKCQVVLIVADNKKNERKNNICIFDVGVRKNRLQRVLYTTILVLRQVSLLESDVYHFHDPELIPVGLLLKAQGKKVIYDVHEDLPRQTLSKDYIPQKIRKITAFTLELIENFSAKYFDAIVTATPHIRERFQKLGCNAINVNNYPILSELYSPDVNWSQKESAVCYVGGIANIRGIFEMVEAISQTDAKLLLAGKFSSASQRSQAMEMPGWTSVKELGQLNRQEVAQTLGKSVAGLVVLHPVINYIDALPVKMFEYMSAGIPVIASNFPLWIEIIEGNQCGICVDPLNPQAIATAIQWFLEHPEEAKRMGENGRKAVEEKYNWETEAEKLRSLYSKLLT